jgi:tRNA (cmo5U34)-methyltransferase
VGGTGYEFAVTTAAETFSAHAREYTEARRRLVAPYEAFYGAVGDVLEVAAACTGSPLRRVLDLGAGTGLLTEMVAAAHPEATVELLDASEAMLAQARARLGVSAGAVHVADMTAPLPDGPYDAVVSALAIHHLSDRDKRDLFARVHGVLAAGGAFVNAEQVAGPSESMERAYRYIWERDCRAAGASEADLAGARQRMRHDRCADLEAQLRWLREAGFATVDCVFKSWRFAVIAAFKEVDR